MRPHWDRCIVHFDSDVRDFAVQYFGRPDRRCLVVSGAGFDPRSVEVPKLLSGVMNERVFALVIREERGVASDALRSAANSNEVQIRRLIPGARTVAVDIFAADGAVIGGQRIVRALQEAELPDGLTDVVLDTSALSIGVAFPAAAYLLGKCEERGSGLNCHLMIASNPELDARIVGETTDKTSIAKGFDGNYGKTGDDQVASMWLPQLGHRGNGALAVLNADQEYFKVCPILPFPARNPRRPDDLIREYVPELFQSWNVGPRDLIFASERNPVDMYRTLSVLKTRYEKTVRGFYTPQIVISPHGSKVMAAGAMMAALEHGLTVKYVEALRYEVEPSPASPGSGDFRDLLVHVWLHGYVYDALSDSGVASQ